VTPAIATPSADAYDLRNAQRAAQRSSEPAQPMPAEWQNFHEENRVSQENAARQATLDTERAGRTAAAQRGSSTDGSGRATPNAASEDYHDRMNR
jgi:hypothetical protein